MRPPGEVREALRAAFEQLCEQQGACNWRATVPLLKPLGIDPASRAEVRLVRATVENMVRAGELDRVGAEKEPGKRVWRALYAPRRSSMRVCGLSAVDEAMRSWVMRR